MPIKEYAVCPGVKWIDVLNPSQQEMQQLSDEYKLNHYTVLDCMQPEHLPKYELVDDVQFLILRFYARDAGRPIATIQQLTNKIAIFCTDKFIITIHKSEALFPFSALFLKIKKNPLKPLLTLNWCFGIGVPAVI